MNTLYDHEHHLTQADVDAANALVRHIERTRNPRVPQVGDRVRYTTRHGDFHGNALIEAVREDGTRSICLCPYVPFVWMTAGGIGCAVSGGPFTAVMPQELKPSGAVPGDFCAWGHCGACGNGVVRFCAEVPLWEYREPESLYGDFSTEKWRKIRLYKDAECRNGDLYRGDCISFRTEKEVPTFSLRLRRNGIRGSRPEIRHHLVLSGRADRRIAREMGCARCSRFRAAHLQRAPARETRQGSRAAYHGLLFRQTGIFL